jgi:polyisoprenoid-binding protein YceI
MKKAILFGGIAFVALCAFVVNTNWKVIEPEKVVVNFALKQDGTKGTIKGVDAAIVFDESDLGKASIKATVKVKSLSTSNAKRDEHLMSADFFDAGKYPTITFVSSDISKSKNGFTAKGKLTMKDKTLDVSVPFTLEEKDGKASFKGKMDVSPYKFGVMKSDKSKDEIVSISVDIPLKK